MPDEYPILDCTDWVNIDIESIGTRKKEWRKDPSGVIWLVKEHLRYPSETWTEKVACELAALLGLPHAHYELGCKYKELVSLSRTFIDRRTDTLYLGNQLLNISNDERVGTRRNAAVGVHTVENFLEAGVRCLYPRGWDAPSRGWNGRHAVVGCLMFDAWIGNTDRHEQNWGWLSYYKKGRYPGEFSYSKYLAPVFDNSSSLGWHVPAEEKRRRLSTLGEITAFAKCSVCEFYPPAKEYKITTMDAFKRAAYLHPGAAKVWLNILRGIKKVDTISILRRLPSTVVSSLDIDFATELLYVNQNRLIEFGAKLRP